jgi:uncharacterized phiE125 gp8 family phage protein
VAASTQLATRAALKLYLGIDGAETGEDDLLEALLAYASERIESYCSRRFAEEELTEYIDGDGTDRLVLGRRPVASLAGIYVDSDREFGEDTKLLELERVLYPATGIVVWVGGIFPRGTRNVKAVYTAGYAQIPDDLAAACVKLAASWYAHAKSGADGVRRETLGDYSADYACAELPADVEAMLAPYREAASV